MSISLSGLNADSWLITFITIVYTPLSLRNLKLSWFQFDSLTHLQSSLKKQKCRSQLRIQLDWETCPLALNIWYYRLQWRESDTSFWWQRSLVSLSRTTVASSEGKRNAGFLGWSIVLQTQDQDQLQFLQYWELGTATRTTQGEPTMTFSKSTIISPFSNPARSRGWNNRFCRMDPKVLEAFKFQ